MNAPSTPVPGSMQRPRVLVVDDVADNLHTVLNILGSEFQLQAATHGEKALELARRRPRPDLILLDIRMPGMNGFEVLHALRADPETADIPVIFLTALSDAEDEAIGLRLGAADYVSKPVNPELLVMRVRNQLELRRHRRRAEAADDQELAGHPGKATLLLVDDMPENLHALVGALQDDYRILVAADGARALELVEGPQPPDAVLLDVMMPGLDGYQVCAMIKATAAGRHLPVIFITVVGGTADKVRGFAVGAADYITKPFEIEEVRARVRTHIDLNHLRRSLEELVGVRMAALREANEALAESREKYRVLADYSPNWEYWMGPDGEFLYVSPACTEVSGYAPVDFMVEPGLMRRLVHPDDLAKWDAPHDPASREARRVAPVRIRRRDGAERWIEHLAQPVYDSSQRFLGTRGSNRDITQQRLAEERNWHAANYDALTGLPNRGLFNDRLDQEIRRASRDASTLAVLFIDLDRFKEVNDSVGHDVGDKLLVEAARRIQGCLRPYDTVARLGGDEFLVILGRLPAGSGVERRVADDIVRDFSAVFRVEGGEHLVSASVGIAMFPADGRTAGELTKQADQAMYLAKRTGRGCYRYFTDELQRDMDHRLKLLKELRQARDAGQFAVHYQPIIDLADGRVCKAEALLRWTHPVEGPVSPAVFIPLAEDTGLIREIGAWVFTQVVAQARAWTQRFGPDFQISVNVSPAQLNAPAETFQQWAAVIAANGLRGANLAIEITEGLLLEGNPQIVQNLRLLRDAGVQIVVDDFGMGYSSLGYLKKFVVDVLKIDQSFVQSLPQSRTDVALCEAIVSMAHRLGIPVVGEGVETAEQRAELARMGCDQVQGFLFAPALPPGEFERRFAAQHPAHSGQA